MHLNFNYFEHLNSACLKPRLYYHNTAPSKRKTTKRSLQSTSSSYTIYQVILQEIIL